MSLPKKKRKIKRDKQGLAKTLTYLLTTRGGRPTTVKQAARDLRITAQAASYRFTALKKQGKTKRVARGVFAPNGGTTPQLPLPLTDPNKDLLDHLLQEREQLDAKIEKVREVIKMQNDRTVKP